MVRIEHPETGKHFAVSEEDYHSKPMTSLDGQTYEEAGYEIVSYEDGTAYEEGAEPTKWAVDNTGTVEIGTEGEEDVIDPTSEARRRRPDGETDDAEAEDTDDTTSEESGDPTAPDTGTGTTPAPSGS
jgi:hypothetical protein